MKEKIKSVYYCDYCSKFMFKKYAMIKHEKDCMLNPENESACGKCGHLKNIKIGLGNETDWCAEGKANGFYCKFTDKYLYPSVARRVKMKYPEQFEDQEEFLKTCEIYEKEKARYENLFKEV